jgi:ubiquinone/menaquinone biosynthesis C-methylase UbiE
MTLALTFHQLPLLDISGPIRVNGHEFTPVDSLPGVALYEGPTLSRVSFISLPHPRDGVALPRELWADNEHFVRRFETYYTAEYSGAVDVEALFNHLSTQYEKTIDRPLNEQVIRLMFRQVADYARNRNLPLVRVLDFGCGSGISWETLQSQEIGFPCRIELLGCDFAESMVHVCREKGFPASKSAYSRTPYLSRYFDAIICSFVVHYFMDYRPIYEIARVLRTPGILLYNAPRADVPDPNYYTKAIPAAVLRSGRSVTREATIWNLQSAVARHVSLYSCVLGEALPTED